MFRLIKVIGDIKKFFFVIIKAKIYTGSSQFLYSMEGNIILWQ